MNPINRVGQKVVCVTEFEIYDYLGNLFCGPSPRIDGVYTVAGFLNNEGAAASLDLLDDIGPGIELREVPSVRGKGGTRSLGWPIIGFRPLLDRETDISALVEAGKSAHLLDMDEIPFVVEVPL